MVEKVNKDIVSFNESESSEQTSVRHEQKIAREKLQTGRQDVGGNANTEPKKQARVQPVRVEQKVGRNEPCPCGSGKKFKQCHGK